MQHRKSRTRGVAKTESVTRTEGGKHRGFGFVTFVSHKGSAFAVKEAGDPPEMMVDGRKCNVRYTEDRGPDLRGVNTNAL